MLSEKRAWVVLVTTLRVYDGRTTDAPVRSFDEVVKTERISAVERAVMAGMAAAASASQVVLIVVAGCGGVRERGTTYEATKSAKSSPVPSNHLGTPRTPRTTYSYTVNGSYDRDCLPGPPRVPIGSFELKLVNLDLRRPQHRWLASKRPRRASMISKEYLIRFHDWSQADLSVQ